MAIKNNSIKNLDLNEICTKLLNSVPFRIRLYRLLQKEPDCLFEVKDFDVEETVLNRLLDKSRKSKIIGSFISLITDAANQKSITDIFVDKVLELPDKHTKEALVISLSHKDLPIKELKKLSETNICFECYFELIIKIFSSDEYDVDALKSEMERFLSSPYSCMLSQLTDEISFEITKDENKRAYLQSLKP